MRVGIIGLGTMGGAMARGLLASDEDVTVSATTRRAESAQRAGADSDFPVGADNVALARASDAIVLAVKPYQARAVAEEIAAELDGKLLVSICASIRIDDLRTWTGDRAVVVRAMPNTPCAYGKGMTVLAPGPGLSERQREIAEGLFRPLGRTAILDEALMDAATGLSGCGPAYVFLIIEALSEAGVKLGIDRRTSTLLAAQTVLGGAHMVLESGEHPAALKDAVTTPAGCTTDALMVMEDGRLRSTLIRGVVAAAERSRSLRDPA